MALEHALLVSLSERPATGIELARRFDASIGYFWQATHQQIYRVLARMEADGWVSASRGEGRSTERRYAVTAAGSAVLAAWVAAPTAEAAVRSEVAVKMRGASYGDRDALLADLRRQAADHRTRLAHYEHLQATQFPDPDALDGRALDSYLVLRGGIRQEEYWIAWLEEYVAAHGSRRRPPGAESSTATRTEDA